MAARGLVVTLLARLLRRLDLAGDGDDRFLGGAGAGGVTVSDRLFGGLVAAQAAVAAARTAGDFPMHSLHAYFLRPGRPDSPIRFEVNRDKDGRNFRARSVRAWQQQELVFQLQASFARPAAGVHHQTDMPAVASPETLPNRDALRGRENWRDMPIDVRMVTEITGTRPLPPRQMVWLKPGGRLPEDPALHLGMLVYASDRTLLDTAWRPHAGPGAHAGASLDHSMWFHQPPRFDDWHLYVMDSPAAAGGRGFALGALYCATGQRTVTVAQEGVLRSA